MLCRYLYTTAGICPLGVAKSNWKDVPFWLNAYLLRMCFDEKTFYSFFMQAQKPFKLCGYVLAASITTELR